MSDLTFSNDENEIVYGLSRVAAVVADVCSRWRRRDHADAVRQIAEQAIRRFKSEFHVYALCFSVERDTAQHWDRYGGGLHTKPVLDDPHVAIGIAAQALFHPIELSAEKPPMYVINTVCGDDAADRLAQYWAIKTRKALEVLDAPRVPLSIAKVYDAFKRMLVLACAVVKNKGWLDEHEYRLLYITKDFGEEHAWLPQRPDGRGRYAPLLWSAESVPVRTIMPHPLADPKIVEKALRTLPGGSDIGLIRSELKPRHPPSAP